VYGKIIHLKFHQKVFGKPRFNGGGETHPNSKKNKDNREGHSGYLSNKKDKIKSGWQNEIDKREQLELAPLDSFVIPVFLKINPDILGNDFDLKEFGIEVIS